MIKSLRDRWCAALRSGEYRQGTDVLRQCDGDGHIRHCCLGVLCEIAGFPSNSAHFFSFPGDPSYSMEVLLTPEALDFVGLPNQDQVDLAYLNDGGRISNQKHGERVVPSARSRSFTEIANWIEHYVAVEPDEVTPAPAHSS